MKIRTGHLPILWELLFRSILYLEILLYIMKRKNEREGGLLEKEKVKFFRLKEGFEPFAAPELGVDPACYQLIYQGATI